MIWLKVAGILVGVVAVVWAALAAYGHWRWQDRTARLMADMAAAEVPLLPGRYDPAMLKGLPAPVARYLEAVLVPGQPMVRAVTIRHRGTFNMGEVADNWKPFTSTQRVKTSPPGFVWDGSVRMMPGLPVRVHDAYVAGEGVLAPAILGLFPMVEMRGGGDIAAGELMRYLAEAAWYPTVLLPGQGVTWRAIDGRSALATLGNGATTVSLTFRFDEGDLVSGIRAEARGRTVAGAVVPTPWEGRWSMYERQGGMLVPGAGVVAWVLPEGNKPYWRGQITSISYEFAE